MMTVSGPVQQMQGRKESSGEKPQKQKNGSLEGYNAFHLNALYDLCNKIYIDAVIEPHPGAEAKAAWNMVDRGRFDKAILMGDRGYSAMNLMEHIHRKPGLDYLFRVKNGWISELRKLPMADFDIDISFELRTTQRKEDLELYRQGQAKLIYGPSKFGKTKKLEQWDFESPFRNETSCCSVQTL